MVARGQQPGRHRRTRRREEEETADGQAVRGAGPVVPGDAAGTVELDREVPVQVSSATMAPTRQGRRKLKRALNKMKVDSNPLVI